MTRVEKTHQAARGLATQAAKMRPKNPAKAVSKEDLQRKLAQKESMQLINVSEPRDYKFGTIKGSYKIPFSQLGMRFKEIDRSKKIVVYCAGPECPLARMATAFLASKGFHVGPYLGGAKEWLQAALPKEENTLRKGPFGEKILKKKQVKR